MYHENQVHVYNLIYKNWCSPGRHTIYSMSGIQVDLYKQRHFVYLFQDWPHECMIQKCKMMHENKPYYVMLIIITNIIFLVLLRHKVIPCMTKKNMKVNLGTSVEIFWLLYSNMRGCQRHFWEWWAKCPIPPPWLLWLCSVNMYTDSDHFLNYCWFIKEFSTCT